MVERSERRDPPARLTFRSEIKGSRVSRSRKPQHWEEGSKWLRN
jgi:hypothetical protein